MFAMAATYKLTVLNHKYKIVDYLLSQLRDRDTEAKEFRHFSGRIMHLLIEEALS